jgi:hypothetical protein
MKSLFIVAMFGILLFQAGISRSETFAECLTRCSAEISSGNANCPPAGDEARTQCLKDNQEALKRCIDSCPKAAPADTPTDTPKDTPKDTPLDTPKDTPDTPKEN